MTGAVAVRIAGLMLTVAVLGGCELVAPDDPPVPPGGRAIVIPVENTSTLPAVLIVAEDRTPIGRAVGASNPSIVPPGVTVDVTFHVPPSETWAIFVNPGPERGPLLIAHDLRRCIGRVPIGIHVGRGGEPVWSMAAGPSCVDP